MVPSSASASPIVWALHDGKAGMASQAVGLAEATGFDVIEKRLAIRFPWEMLPPRLWFFPSCAVGGRGERLTPPWPELVVACGRNAAVPALLIKRASGGRTVAVQIQNPGVGHTEFDLFVVPEHDRVRAPRVIVTRGAVHRITQARLAAEASRFPALAAMPRPILALLIGGTNKAYHLRLRRLGEIAETIATLLRSNGGSALVTLSRRTEEGSASLMRDRLKGLSTSIWDGTGDNPYFAFLALADAFFVTADSVSMISEAAATGKPVHVLALDGGNAKFSRFHATMEAAGITRPFTGRIESWSYAVPDDTPRAGAALRELVLRGPAKRERL